MGAQSLAFHGRPRYTGDLDILIRATSDNAQRLLGVLTQFGFAQSGFKPDQMIQLGRAPTRIDLLTSISGVTIDDAVGTRVSAVIDGIPVFTLGRDALIQNKRRSAGHRISRTSPYSRHNRFNASSQDDKTVRLLLSRFALQYQERSGLRISRRTRATSARTARMPQQLVLTLV